MKTIILVSLCLCLLASAINADKSHKHQGKLLKSGHEEHKKHADLLPLNKDEAELKTHQNPAHEQAGAAAPAKPARKHRNNHHGKNKKGANAETAHAAGRSRKSQTKPNKHNGQRSHNKQHGRKHGRGKQAQ